MITTPIPHTNVKNGQPPLDNTRPFMDDTGRPRRERGDPSSQELRVGRTALLLAYRARDRAVRPGIADVSR